MIPEDNPERALLLGSLGTKLSYRYLRTGEAQDLEKALGLVQEAIELTPDANSDRASFLSNLGGVLESQYTRTGDVKILQESTKSRNRQSSKYQTPIFPIEPVA